VTGVAKAAAVKAGGAKAPTAAAPPKGNPGKGNPGKGKAGKVARPRTGLADFMTLMVCIGCTVWAFQAIVALSGQSF
jgi:hypothetical protein